ncbi:MAG: hypothetical protein RBT65_12065 [Methanolobus sp.]|jgi:plastocyanin|nr:hypothetical protein [Bacteroidales bacterium]MDY0387833.1 hypothetical protein [Methanolobus sp.]
MGFKTRQVLKTFFETGDKPTQEEFSDFLDTALLCTEDYAFVKRGEGDIYSPQYQETMTNIFKGNCWKYKKTLPAPPFDGEIPNLSYVIAKVNNPYTFNYNDSLNWEIISFSETIPTLESTADFVAFYEGVEKIESFQIASNDSVKFEARLNINKPYQKIRWSFNEVASKANFISYNRDPEIRFNNDGIYNVVLKTQNAEHEIVAQCIKLNFLTVGEVVQHTVTFNVKSHSGENVENAIITIDGNQIIITDANGNATIVLPNGTYAYNCEKEPNTITGTFTVQDEDLFVQANFPAIILKYTLTFQTIFEEAPLIGVNIILSGSQLDAPSTKVSNNLGVAAFNELLPGTYYYETSLNGYIGMSGQVDITDADEIVSLTYVQSTNTTSVKFVVLDNDYMPIDSAIITLGSIEATTNNGLCIFHNISIGSNQPYIISKEGHYPITKEITEVTSDMTEFNIMNILNESVLLGVSEILELTDLSLGRSTSLNPRSPNCSKTPTLGSRFGEGTVIHILQPGELGYVDGMVKGLILADTDVGTFLWGNSTSVGNTSTEIGYGQANTNNIIATLGQFNNDLYAAKSTDVYKSLLFSDWYLPSRDELLTILDNVESLPPGFSINTLYWTSSQVNATTAYAVGTSGAQEVLKSGECRVRAIRSFQVNMNNIEIDWVGPFGTDAGYNWVALPTVGGITFDIYTKYQDVKTLDIYTWKTITDNYNVSDIIYQGCDYKLYIHKGIVHAILGQIPQEPVNARFKI